MTAQRRVGHLYPSGGISDNELPAMAPASLQFLTTRMPFRNTSREADVKLVEHIEWHAQLLADAQVELIAFNCTAASMIAGPGVIEQRIQAATGIPATTTITAVMAALDALGSTRLGLFTPYRSEISEEECAFLKEAGMVVTAQAHIPCNDPVTQGLIPPQQWRELVLNTDTADCDALLFSCAGIKISPVIQDIERLTSIPVITSNSALLWYVLQRLDLAPITGKYGQLFDCRTS